MENFRVVNRNPGHWDIWAEKRRVFRLRGGPGKYVVIGDHDYSDTPTQPFKTVQACMSYICDLLMFELILVEGQEPTTIASWNI